MKQPAKMPGLHTRSNIAVQKAGTYLKAPVIPANAAPPVYRPNAQTRTETRGSGSAPPVYRPIVQPAAALPGRRPINQQIGTVQAPSVYQPHTATKKPLLRNHSALQAKVQPSAPPVYVPARAKVGPPAVYRPNPAQIIHPKLITNPGALPSAAQRTNPALRGHAAGTAIHASQAAKQALPTGIQPALHGRSSGAASTSFPGHHVPGSRKDGVALIQPKIGFELELQLPVSRFIPGENQPMNQTVKDELMSQLLADVDGVYP